MAEKVMKVGAIQQRRDTVENWTTKNPILLDGEQITVIFDDGRTRHKTGYGGKRYNELPFDGAESCEPSETVNVTLLANAWVNGQQTLSVSAVMADQNGYVTLPQAFSDAQYDAVVAAEMFVTAQADGSITISCRGDTPQINIPILITLLG
jgi:hypothetical protein